MLFADPVTLFFLFTGTGFGLIFGPTSVIPGLYFDKKLPLGLGLSIAGSGLGSFIFPNLMRYLLDEYSVSGCLLIMGGIVLHVCLFAMLFRPLSYWETDNQITNKEHCTENGDRWTNGLEMKTQDEESKKLLSENNERLSDNRKTWSDSESTKKAGLSRTHSLTWVSNDTNKQSMKSSFSDSHLYFKKEIDLTFSKSNSRRRTETVGNSPPDPSFLNWKMLKDPVFILLTFAIFLAIFAHHIVFNFIPPLADEFGFTESEGALCVSIVGLMDLIGRTSGGVIGNAFFTRRIKLYIICLLVFGTSTMVVIHITNFYVFIVLCAVQGLSTGGYIGVKLSMIADELGKENLPTAWGYIAFFTSFSILINPVISGKLTSNRKISSMQGFHVR
jgi:MFS family permease